MGLERTFPRTFNKITVYKCTKGESSHKVVTRRHSSAFWVKPLLPSTLYFRMAETSAAMQPSPKCRQHQILWGRLQADTMVYAEVTRRLESCKAEDFEQTYRAAESARLAFLRAREALNVHIALHGCER
jgi:hypothetical protein